MTVNMSRSQRQALLEGATDGLYRKARPDTDAVALNTSGTVKARQHLHAEWNYGYTSQEVPPPQRHIPGSG